MPSSARSPRFHGRIPRDAPCAVPGCREAGEFRAPVSSHRSPDGPPPYRYLCLSHVREFNAGYNFFEGMTADQIMAAQSPTAGWETESRAFRPAGSADLPPRWADFKDPMDAVGARFRKRMQEAMPTERKDGKSLSSEDRNALGVLGLDLDADRRALRGRYSELVRRYHPDRNGGDRSREKALQRVIEAYNHLRNAPAFR